jgi:hypothetical protein
MLKNVKIRNILLIFLILFGFLEACKPKYLEEVTPEKNLPKNNKMGVISAKNWWQKQKSNPQNLQQRGTSEPNFEDAFTPDWINAESRISPKGKLQIRVPLNQKTAISEPIFIPFTDEKNEKYFGRLELLLQANPDSSFRKIYNLTGTKDSTNRFDFSKNNFFRKENSFEGKEAFFDPSLKRVVAINQYVNRISGEYVIREVKIAGICFLEYYNTGGEFVTAVWTECPYDGGGGSPITTWFGQIPVGNTPGFSLADGGIGGNGGTPIDPFELPTEEIEPFEPTVDDRVLIQFTDTSSFRKIHKYASATQSYKDFLQNFKTFAKEGAKIKFQEAVLPEGENARTIYEANTGNVIVQINTRLKGKSPHWEIARVMLHEMQHAQWYAELAKATNGWTQPLNLQDINTNSGLFVAMQTYSQAAIDAGHVVQTSEWWDFIMHSAMTSIAYRGSIKRAIKQYMQRTTGMASGNSYTAVQNAITAIATMEADLELLTWRGLQNTKIFADKAKTETTFEYDVFDSVKRIRKNNIISHNIPN